MKMFLISALFIISTSSQAAGFACDDETLFDTRGREIHSFTFSSDCTQALQQLSYGVVFCDGGELYNLRGLVIRDLDFYSSCTQATSDARWYQGHFCHNGTLMSIRGNIVREFAFSSDCRRALQEMFKK